MNLEKLEKILEGQPKFRLKQVKQAVFSDMAENFEQITALPKNLREILSKDCSLEINSEIFEDKFGNSVKALITLEDGKKIETVLMKHKDKRNTVCVSSQVGCPMKCDFCATGKMGLKRNLSVWEILEQVILFARVLKKKNERVTNVVFMGMGEPFLNYENVMTAIKILNEEMEIGARKISVSTCGIIEGIEKFSKESLQLNLAISLHAADDVLRKKIMPIAGKVSLEDLMRTIGHYQSATGRKVMIEYVMLKDVNDSEESAEKLGKLLSQFLDEKLFMVNLISYNETGDYRSSSSDVIRKFREILEGNGIETTQRFKLGRDIHGACGQLVRRD